MARVAFAVVVLTLALAGCGGSNTVSSPSATPIKAAEVYDSAVVARSPAGICASASQHLRAIFEADAAGRTCLASVVVLLRRGPTTTARLLRHAGYRLLSETRGRAVVLRTFLLPPGARHRIHRNVSVIKTPKGWLYNGAVGQRSHRQP
jgi:hypothetical protein